MHAPKQATNVMASPALVAASVSSSADEVRRALPRGRGALPPEVVSSSQRRRLLAAMAQLAGTKGIVELTVSDLIAEAGVGRKSFYALFRDKHDCYVQAFTINGEFLVSVTSGRMRQLLDPLEGLREGFRHYLRTMHEGPVHARAFLFESLRAGPDALAERQRIHRMFEHLFMSQYEKIRHHRGRMPKLPASVFVAMVAAVNELVFRELEQHRDPEILALEPHVLAVVESLIRL